MRIQLALGIVVIGACGDNGSRPIDAHGVHDVRITDTPLDAPSLCGANVRAYDDWTTTTAGSQWTVTTDPDITITEGGGQLAFAFKASTAAGAAAGYVEAAAIDFTGGCMFTGWATTPNQAKSAYGEVLIGDTTTSVGYRVQAGMLEAISVATAGGSATIVHQAPYDSTADHFLRVRESAGTITWETSPDSVAFTDFASAAETLTAASMKAQLGATAPAAVTNAGTVTFLPISIVSP